MTTVSSPVVPIRPNRRRFGVAMRYLCADLHAYYGWNQNSIVCRGVEPTGHWANRWEAIEKIGPWW